MIERRQLSWMTTTMEAIQADEKYALNGGPFGSKLVSKMYVESGVPVIRGINLPLDKRFSFDGLVFVSEEKAEELKANIARPGDVVFTQRGTLGQVGIIPDSSPFSRFVISQSQMKLTVNRDLADPHFIYYLFRSPEFVERVSSLASSSGVPHINLDTLRKFTIDLPPLPTQQRIAAILSAYDDLIENNMRRIAILEEMARRLYDEWFVHFRFPGHEEAAFTETALGLAPEDWELVELEQLVQVNPRTSVPRDGTKPFVPMGSLSENNMIIGPIEEREGNSGTKFQNGDTLVARITPCLENGKTGFVDFLPEEQTVAFGSTEFIVLRPSLLGKCAIYCLARSHAFRDVAIKSMSGSEGRQRVRPESVKGFPMARPPADLLDRFERFSAPIFAQVTTLARKNVNLRTQRDLMLPRLISGEIDVREAEATLEAAE